MQRMCKVTLIAGGSSTLGFDSQLNLLLIAQNSTISSMVSLTIVAAALGLVTFGNAEVASRYLKSSSQPGPKETEIPFKFSYDSKKCLKEGDDEKVKFVQGYDIVCKGNSNLGNCHELYEAALRNWITVGIGSDAETVHSDILAGYVGRIFAGYDEKDDAKTKQTFMINLAKNFPSSFDKKSGQQATFGFKGKNAKFLGQLGMFMQASCLRN